MISFTLNTGLQRPHFPLQLLLHFPISFHRKSLWMCGLYLSSAWLWSGFPLLTPPKLLLLRPPISPTLLNPCSMILLLLGPLEALNIVSWCLFLGIFFRLTSKMPALLISSDLLFSIHSDFSFTGFSSPLTSKYWNAPGSVLGALSCLLPTWSPGFK